MTLFHNNFVVVRSALRVVSSPGYLIRFPPTVMRTLLGSSFCLNTSFHHLGTLATPCWCKSLWEGLDHFGLTFDMETKEIPFPRANDALLSSLFIVFQPGSRHAQEPSTMQDLLECTLSVRFDYGQRAANRASVSVTTGHD